MPGLMPMRSLGTASKARRGGGRTLGRVKAEKGEQQQQLVRVPSQTLKMGAMGLLSAQFAAANKTELRRKLFGTGVDVENRFGNQYVSSGSEHDVNSVCLGAMVDGFFENDDAAASPVDDMDDARSSLGGEPSEILQELVANLNATERILLAVVNKEMKAAATARQVMKALRSVGYNAAVCKSRWDPARSFPGGDHEYIDVVFEGATGKSERIMIDIDFRAQFEIARPTACYNAVVQVLPTVFIGKADRLLQVVNLMSDAAKTSLKKRGMSLPPWRKPEYMRAKWFSSYRRTTNGTAQKTHASNEMEVMKKAVAAAAVVAPTSKLVVDNSEWTPPALKPRVFQRPAQAGLASILREAGLISTIMRQKSGVPIVV